jgi:hypothetical protein
MGKYRWGWRLPEPKKTMNKKEFAVIVMLGMLAILQVSFAPHFELFDAPWFWWANFVDVAVLAIAIFEHRRGRVGWIAALWGGIFLDMYSTGSFFGFWILLLGAVVAIVKLVLKKYVRIPSFW